MLRIHSAMAIVFGIALAVASVVVGVGQQVAAAAGCTSLELPISIATGGIFNARVGTVIDFTVSSTLAVTDCPISNATITFTDPHGASTTLATSGSVGTGASMTWGTVPYTIVQGDIGQNGAPAGFVLGKAAGNGTATESTGATVPQSGAASVDIFVNQPATTLTESTSPTSGRAPLAVTFTYHESNTGTDPISSVVVSGSICGTATYVSGDTNSNGILDPGETWVFSCSHTFTTATGSPFTDTATATGTDTVDSLAAPTESASASVTVTQPATANLTPGFWKNHQAATTALLPQTLGAFAVTTFAQAKAILSEMGCGNVGALNCMAGMLLAAELNLAQGGSTCIVTDGVIAQANALLIAYSYDGPGQSFKLTKSDQTLAMKLHDELSAYNIDGIPTC